MALDATRTHTVYFDEESLAPLREALADLEREWALRQPHVDEDTADMVDRRLQVLDAALALLGEAVP